MSGPPPVPPGWPPEVPPPGHPEHERRAVAWLFDQVPPDYRSHEVLRRHPVLLARLAREHLVAGVEAARAGLATARADLADVVPPDAVEALLLAYEREGMRLAAASRSVARVERALRGERWVPRL